jgi:copper(I)-binding protein
MSRTPRFARLGGLVAAIGAAALLLSACSSGGSASISVTDPWVRATPASAGVGVAYMTIQNTGSAADTLVGASSPVANAVEIHETMVMGTPLPSASDAMGSMAGASPMPMGSSMAMASPLASTSGDMMGMEPVARLEIPAGGTVQLAPGGYHIMLIGLTKDLNVGDTVQVTLKFEKAGDVTVTAQVRAS